MSFLVIPTTSRINSAVAKRISNSQYHQFKRKKNGFIPCSVSFPSSSHPLINQFNDHLCRLKPTESTSTSSSLPSISNRLSSLEQLYDCVDDLLQAPHSQQNSANETWVDEALDGYLSLLDTCASTKAVLSQTKEDVQQLLSSIRRNKDLTIFQGYIASRKKIIKAIRRLLKDLKSIGSKHTVLQSNQDATMLREAQEVTISEMHSLLSYVGGTKAHSKSLISKFLKKNGTKEVTSEFEQIDISMISPKNTETLQIQLREIELSTENIEKVLECFIRRLIKTRVSLLNILNH